MRYLQTQEKLGRYEIYEKTDRAHFREEPQICKLEHEAFIKLFNAAVSSDVVRRIEVEGSKPKITLSSRATLAL